MADITQNAGIVTDDTPTSSPDKTQVDNTTHTGFWDKVKGIGVKIVHGLEIPVKIFQKVDIVIQDVIKDEPELKSLITTMVAKAETIGMDTLGAVGDRGVNLVLDEKDIADMVDFFKFVNTSVVPEFIKIYGQIKTDISAEDTAEATAAVKASVANIPAVATSIVSK